MEKKQVLLDTNILMATEDYVTMVSVLEADVILIPIEALEELDNLKTAPGRKGFQARRAVRKIEQNIEAFDFVKYEGAERNLKNDDKMVHTVYELSLTNGDVTLITNDIAMKIKATAIGVEVENYFEEKDVGEGWHKLEIENSTNPYPRLMAMKNILPGEYVITYSFGISAGIFIKQQNKSYEKVHDRDLVISSARSARLGPYDEFQTCAFDALKRNDFTILTGKAGTGKTLLSLSKILESLQAEEVSKVVIFTNPTKARGSEDLGFYKGDREGKLLQNSIGAILISKLGSITALEEMLENETLIIMPMSDIRGYEVPEDAYLYISEAQNADVGLLQLAIQRASGGPVIIEGDPFTQLDHWSYGGENNGMLKAIEVFKGFDKSSHVHLPIIYRSPVAKRADLMTEDYF